MKNYKKEMKGERLPFQFFQRPKPRKIINFGLFIQDKKNLDSVYSFCETIRTICLV